MDINSLDKKTFNLIFIFALSFIFWLLLQLFTRKLVNNISTGTPSGRRFRTLSNLVKTAVSILILGFAIFETLSVFGVDLAPLAASAGVIGLAIGFGSQALIKDVISGFFLLAEDQFDIGDEIQIADKKGIVKNISLRTVWLEDKDGALHIVPNGAIVVVSNFSRKKLDKKR